MISRTLRWFFGDFSQDDLRRYSLLAMTLFFIVGSYWLLRPLKDSIFASVVGIEYQPAAKMLSLCVLVPAMFAYAKLVDLLDKNHLFYCMTIFYISLFIVIDVMLGIPSLGLENTQADASRLLGWFLYISVESFGSIMVAMFWSFVTSTVDSNSAKQGFPMILAIAQVGAIIGPTLDTYATVLGIPLLIAIAIVGMVCTLLLIRFYVYWHPKPATLVKEKTLPKTGVFEGLRLLITQPYVLGILGVATAYEIIYTILDYQMKVLGRQTYTTPESFTEFLGRYGQSVNFIALIFALTGTGYLLRRYGVRFCLLCSPILVAGIVLAVYVWSGLWQVFAAVVIIKGLAYGLNNPTKEILYIPTSKDVRYKAKSWIDMFGSRGAKAMGSSINQTLAGSASVLLVYGSIASLIVVAVWIVSAAYVGRSFDGQPTHS